MTDQTNLPEEPTAQLPADQALEAALAEKKTKKEKKEKKKKKKASKGVETMFRTTLGNHLRLSEMADQKANLMITINTLLISITISSFLRPVAGADGLLIPEILLLIVSLITVVISIFATKPSFSLRKNVMPRIHPPIDLLFFGDYTQLSAAQYREQLQQLIANEEGLYNSMIDNIYAQGLVLSKKYRLLTVAYNFFMVGFSVVVLSSLVMLVARR
ncbi:Pycsar system effector family protein [Fibrella aquatilis]|uniref:Metal-dependent phosphohydrolase n=1 Tax=Fibrella aquatilis TaxID=2817059 RepID=A0A939JZ21_9BACT|nr:Pycsar system effector family protein [Fibrella aquatilis]MBO0930476.1 metal-dependent phosphohydrolase [Fibrella aquatilis]